MKRLINATAAAAVMLTASCCTRMIQEDRGTASTPPLAITARLDAFSKATDSAFERGDRIGVSVTAGNSLYIDNVAFAYEAGKWTPEIEVNWYEDKTATATVSAIYPCPESSMSGIYPNGSTPYEFTVRSDQSTHEGYTGSDLMMATRENVHPGEEPVELVFRHVLSKLVLNVSNTSGKTLSDLYVADVYGKVQYSGRFTTAGAKGAVKAVRLTEAAEGYSASYQVIIPPQTVCPKIVLTTEEGDEYEYAADAEATFSSGKERRAALNLTANSLSVEMSSEIEEWTPDSDLNFHCPEVIETYINQIVDHGVEGQTYRTTGVIHDVKSLTYGNFHLKDRLGDIYIYGTANIDQYRDRIADGVMVTVCGEYAIYNGTAELMDVTIEAMEDIKTIEDAIADLSGNRIYCISGVVESIEGADRGNLYFRDDTGTIFACYAINWSSYYGLITEGTAITVCGRIREYNGTPELYDYYIKWADIPTDEWVSIGTGKIMDIAFNHSRLLWDVEYEKSTTDEGSFRIRNPYCCEGFAQACREELGIECTYDYSEIEDNYLYFNIKDGTSVWMPNSDWLIVPDFIHDSRGGYKHICIESYAENEDDGEDYYGEYNSRGYIHFPYAFTLLFSYDADTGNYGWDWGCIGDYYYFILPGGQMPFYLYTFTQSPYLTDEGEISMTLGIAQPEELYYQIFEGTVDSSTFQDIVDAMKDGSISQKVIQTNGAKDIVIDPEISKTGRYTFLIYHYTSDGGWRWYWHYFSYIAPGDDIPEATLSNFRVTADPAAPECAVDIYAYLDADSPARAAFHAVKKSELQAFLYENSELSGIDEAFAAHLFRYAPFASFGTADPGVYNNLTGFIPDLEPDTDYYVGIYAENSFGASTVKHVEYRTGAENPSLWHVVAEDARWYENHEGWGDSFIDLNGATVTVMQYGDAARYKVIDPYLSYWRASGDESYYNALPDRDVDFWVRDFDFFGRYTEKGIYYKPFASGALYDGALTYLLQHYMKSYHRPYTASGTYVDETGGVYGFGGLLNCTGGVSSIYGYNLYYYMNDGAGDYSHYMLSLTPDGWARPIAQAQAARQKARRQPEELMRDYGQITAGSYLDTLVPAGNNKR